MTPTRNKGDTTAARFGTFGGVFTPCTLTILGVIMFLRLGQVVGRAGILQALAIILLAHLLTTNPQWRKRDIRLLRIASTDAGREEMTRHLAALIESSRIRAVPRAIVADDVPAAIQETSRDAAVVILECGG